MGVPEGAAPIAHRGTSDGSKSDKCDIVSGLTGSEYITAGIDIRNYAKYILREGTVAEKRELLGCLKSRVFLKNKQIYLGLST